MKETVSNDSTKKQLGFEYQKLIALEYCLNAKNGEYVYIECFGDVEYDVENVEVKHHEGNSNLTSNSVDVWKTLKNLVVEYKILKSNDKFILHTTEDIKNNSIFYNWNTNTKAVKYKKLKEHSISGSSKEFYDVIFDVKKIKKVELLELLDKFIINSSQPKIAEKLIEIFKHPTFALIPENLRSPAIGVLNQWIIDKAINNSNKWEINITDFKSDLQASLSKFTKDYIPFPNIEKLNLDYENLKKEFEFIKKLEAILLKKNDLHQAFQDYTRSEEAYQVMLKINPTLKNDLISYEDDLKDDLTTEKSKVSYSLSKDSFNNDSHIDKARDVYFNCIGKPHSEIIGVKGTQKYFRDGRIQNINEATNFEWLFKENDL